MIVTALLASAIAATQNEPVELLRQFTKGEKLEYQVRAHLQTEQKQIGQPFFMPSDLDMNYDFSLQVKDLKADGFAEVLYKRPTITQIDGETAERPPLTHVEKINWNMSMVISPINELTDMKDLNPPAKPALFTRLLAPYEGVGGGQLNISFVTELYRMVLFVGSLDSALDFSPKLPFEEVKKGSTWKRTVSYQPQALKGADGRHAVQRLDYTYTYDGLVDIEGGKKAHQITGRLNLDTDAASFINQSQGTTSAQSGLKALPLKLDTTVVFLLDAKTCHTLSARADSKGGWSLSVAGSEKPVVEEKISGRTSLKLTKLTK